ncbi:MAG: hypothetical protein KIT34_00750 [Cyanobacteria bacterium TGS_CYA1]|nr:hypothetical protein [Cyanobacteria bacterium TGS_CYA1]
MGIDLDAFEDFEVIASDEVIFKYPNGEMKPGKIFLSAPVIVPNDSIQAEMWGCIPGTIGLKAKGPIFGMSALHSLLLAIRFLQMRLKAFQEEGGEVLYADGSSEHFILNDYYNLVSS